MKYPVYNQEGKESGEVTLPKDIFEVAFNADLVHQVAVSQQANRRQGSAHTKDRSEVRGGGKKPWRQKGTGRARHGSSRSPIWRGGGITFGPRNEKVYEREIPKKMRKKALCMVLTEKAKNNLLVVLDEFSADTKKTKGMAAVIKKLPAAAGSRLVLYPATSKNVYLASRNIAKTGVLEARNLNIVDLLNHKYALVSKAGLEEIKEVLAKTK